MNDFIKARKLTLEKAQTLADGRIFSGKQAFDAGLVDHLAGLNEAIAFTAKKAGIQGKPLIIKKSKANIGNWLAMIKGQFKTMLLSFLPSVGPSIQL